MNVSDIARICHEANKAYCETLGDFSQKSWGEAAEWQQDSAFKGVEWRIANPLAPASAQHDAWVNEKVDSGWKYGPVKDASIKEHPCIVPYYALPDSQKFKDALFVAIVRACVGMMGE